MSEEYGRSVIATPDDLEDTYCEHHVDGGKQNETEGFCVDCSKYLCGQCYKHHTRYKAFENHVLKDKDKMTINETSADVEDVCHEKCGVHSEEVIEYFCQSCDLLACNTCITVNHDQCRNVDHIPGIVKDLAIGQEFKEFITTIDINSEALNERKRKISSNITDNNEMKRKATLELERHREEIKKFFDQLEADMESRIEDIDKNNMENLKSAEIKCNSLNDELEQIKTTVDTKLKNGQKCELFIAMKSNKQYMEKIDKESEKLKEVSKVQRYALTPSSQKQMIKNITEICRLRTAKFVLEINVSTDNDKEEGAICGLAVIQNNYLAVLDSTSKSVKIIDTSCMKVTYEMDMNCDYVYSITNVHDDQIAVLITSEMEEKIQLLSVSMSGSLSTGHQINIDENCGDLVHKGENFYAVCYDGIRIIDMQGKTMKSIKTYNTRSIAVSPDNETIYLTNPTEHTVTSMTLDGKVKDIYKDEDLKRPKGITVGNDGTVYVCCHGTHNIHQLTADCTKVQVLVEDVYGPTITYSNNDKRLYVGLGSKIKVYQTE